jgi:Fe2+ transport system protein FeoA
MPLQMASEGETVRLAEIRGGHGIQLRLTEMGLTPGSEFLIVSKASPGPFIIELKGGRLVIGRGMIDRIFVSPVEG